MLFYSAFIATALVGAVVGASPNTGVQQKEAKGLLPVPYGTGGHKDYQPVPQVKPVDCSTMSHETRSWTTSTRRRTPTTSSDPSKPTTSTHHYTSTTSSHRRMRHSRTRTICSPTLSSTISSCSSSSSSSAPTSSVSTSSSYSISSSASTSSSYSASSSSSYSIPSATSIASRSSSSPYFSKPSPPTAWYTKSWSTASRPASPEQTWAAGHDYGYGWPRA